MSKKKSVLNMIFDLPKESVRNGSKKLNKRTGKKRKRSRR
jgi:hypothetical protein